MYYPCCSEIICKGCIYANMMSNKHDIVKAGSCPFCRAPAAKSKGETRKRVMKRIKANDPAALRQMGMEHYQNEEYDATFEHLTKAAELGNVDAHYRLGYMYMHWQLVEKDEEKALYHWEKAAIAGHPSARHNLAVIEQKNGNMERAVKHFIIAAKLGFDESMNALWKHYSGGTITKENLDATLRTHQAAIDAMKSSDRDTAEVVWKKAIDV
jgi:TPR repeat protein